MRVDPDQYSDRLQRSSHLLQPDDLGLLQHFYRPEGASGLVCAEAHTAEGAGSEGDANIEVVER